MNLKQALKEKNKLKAKIVVTQNRLSKYNRIEEGFERVYDSHEMYRQLLVETDQLIELKTRIQKANLPVLSKIYRLSEVKGLMAKLNKLNCDQGRDIYSEVVYHSAITVVERDNLLLALEQEIEKIQEELDSFNFVTAV